MAYASINASKFGFTLTNLTYIMENMKKNQNEIEAQR